MIEHRPFATLTGTEESWLKAKLHFAFGSMGRPEHSPLGALRVWNDDEFAPFSGFPLHPHKNVEIVTNVREGAITHEDSLGNKGRTAAGDVQVMSAGILDRNAPLPFFDLELMTICVAFQSHEKALQYENCFQGYIRFECCKCVGLNNVKLSANNKIVSFAFPGHFYKNGNCVRNYLI